MLNDQHTDNYYNYPTYNTIIQIEHNNTQMQCNTQADQGPLLHAQICEQSFELEVPPDCSVPHLV